MTMNAQTLYFLDITTYYTSTKKKTETKEVFPFSFYIKVMHFLENECRTFLKHPLIVVLYLCNTIR